MATEDEAREAADGTEVQVEAVDLGTVHLQAHPEGKLSSLMEIKSMGEITDSTEGTLKIPEDQVLVEAPSDVQLPPEHNLNDEASSLNGHTDKEENVSNEQPHDSDQEEVELDQSNGINKDVTDGLSHGENTTEDSCLLKEKEDEEPKGDDQQDLGVTVDDNSVQEDTLKTDNAIEQTDDGQQDHNQESEKANENTEPASITNNADVDNAIEQTDDGQQDQNQEPEKVNGNREPASIANNADAIVAEAPTGLQAPVEKHMNDSDGILETTDEKTETDDPAKEDGVVHPEEVAKVDQQSQQAGTMDADVAPEEIKCEETNQQEEKPKSEAHEPIIDAQGVLNQEPAEETDDPMNEKVEETSHQRNVATPKETTLEHEGTMSAPSVNTQVQNQESLEEIEDTEEQIQPSSDFGDAIIEDQSNLGVTIDNDTVNEDTLRAIEQQDDGQQDENLEPEKATEHTQSASMTNIPHVEIVTETPSGVQTPGEPNLDNSDAVPDTIGANTQTDDPAKTHVVVHPDQKESFPEDASTAEPTEEVVEAEDQQSQQADAMDANMVQEEVPKTEHSDEPATDALEVLKQESPEEIDGPVNTEETAHQETTPECDTTRESPVDIQAQNQESLEEREATVEEREVAEAVDIEEPGQQSSVAFEEAVPEGQRNLGVTNNTVQKDTLEATAQTKDGDQYQDLGTENATEDTQPSTTANISDVEVITEAPSGVQTPGEPNLDISDAIPDTTDGNTEPDEPAKADAVVHPDNKESFLEAISTAEPTEEVVKVEDQQNQQADEMDADVVQEEVPKSGHADEPGVEAQEVLNQESAEETDGLVNEKIGETDHESNLPEPEETTPECDTTTRETPVGIQVQNQESLEEREATVEEREFAEAVDTEAPGQQNSVAIEESVPEEHNLGVTNNTVQEDTPEATGQTEDGEQCHDLEPGNATEDTQPANTANIPDVEVITEAPSGIQTPVEINLDISDATPDTADGNTETDQPAKAQAVVHPDKKESFLEAISTAEPKEEVVKVEDQQSQQVDEMDADLVQEEVPKSEHADEPGVDAQEVLNKESAEETDGPVNGKIEETDHENKLPASEETTPECDTTTRETPVDIQVQNKESLEEREATVEEREVAEAVDTEAPGQQSSAAFEEAVPEDQHNLGVANNTMQEDTPESTRQTKDGEQCHDLGSDNATEDTQSATMANIPDDEVITEAPSGIQTPVEINLDISDAILDTTDGNTETDEPAKAHTVVHPDKESFPEDTSTAEPTEEVVKLEDQQSQQADAMDAEVVQEEVPESEHTDEPGVDAQEVLNKESAEETDGPVNEKMEETDHESNLPASEETTPECDPTTRETPVDIQVQNKESLEEREATVEEREVAEAVDTEAPGQQSSVAFEEAVPEDQHNLGVANNTMQEDTLESTGQTKDGEQCHDLGPDNATEDTRSATMANIPEAPSGIQTPVGINLDISDAILDTTDGNTETDEPAKAHTVVHPDKESFPEDTSTTEPTEEVIKLEDQQSQQADAMDAEVVQEEVPESEHTDEPATDALDVLNQESTQETHGPLNENTEETAHQSNMPTSEETTPEYDMTTRETTVNIQTQNQESLEEREATIEGKEVAEAVDTEGPVQQSSVAFEEEVQEDQLNLGVTNNTVQEDTLEATGQTKDGEQYQDLAPENAIENTQAATTDIPDVEVVTEPPSGIQTPVEINMDISDAIPDTIDGNTETDELVKADDVKHFDYKEGFSEDTCIVEPTEDVIKVEDQLGQQADVIHADVLQEEAPKSEHADDPGVDTKEVLNQESAEETDGLVNVKTEETEHKSQEPVEDAEAVDTEAEMQQSSIAFEETTPENHVATTEPCSEIEHVRDVEPEEINCPGDAKDDEITSMRDTENLVQDNILQSGPTIDIQPVQELEQIKTDGASGHAVAFSDLAQGDATAASEPQVSETEELKDNEATEAEEITILDHVTPSKELAVENDPTADEPHDGEIHQTLEQDLVEVKDTETYHEKIISASEEDTMEDNVTEDEPSCGSQEIDNTGSTEESKQNIAENIAEVSDVVIVDEAIERNALQTEDITEMHKQELEPEETKGTEPVESEETSDQSNAALFDYSAQEDNTKEREMQQTESATEIKEIEPTKVEAVPQESNACVSEEPSQEDHIKESETTSDNQEVNITESLEVIDGHKDIITGGNTASAGGSAEESNVSEGEPPAQAVQELQSEVIKNTQIDEVNETSLEMNATVFQMPTQEENPVTTELQESTEVSNIEATEVDGNPHQINAAAQSEEQATEEISSSLNPEANESQSTSEEPVPEEIATEDNVTTEPDVDHQQLQDQESAEDCTDTMEHPGEINGSTYDELTPTEENTTIEPGLVSSVQEADDPAPSKDEILENDPVHVIQASEKEIADEIEESEEIHEDNAICHDELQTNSEKEESPQLRSNEPYNVDAKIDDTTPLCEEIIHDNASIKPREIKEIGENKGLDSSSEPSVESSIQNNLEDSSSHNKVEDEKLSMSEKNDVDTEAMQEKNDESAADINQTEQCQEEINAGGLLQLETEENSFDKIEETASHEETETSSTAATEEVTINEDITDKANRADGAPSNGSLETFTDTGRDLDVSLVTTTSKEESVNLNLDLPGHPAEDGNTPEKVLSLEDTEREMPLSEKLLQTEPGENQFPNEQDEMDIQDENQTPTEKNEEDMQDTEIGEAKKEVEQELPVSHFLMNLILGKESSDANEDSESEAARKQGEVAEDGSCVSISKQEESMGSLPTQNKVDEHLTFVEQEKHRVKCSEETQEMVKEQSDDLKLDTETSIETDEDIKENTNDLDIAAYQDNAQDEIYDELLTGEAAIVSTKMETRDIDISSVELDDRAVGTVCQENMEASTKNENESLSSSLNDSTNTKATEEDTLGQGQTGLVLESLPEDKGVDAVSEKLPLLTESGITDANDLSSDTASVQNPVSANTESANAEATCCSDVQLENEEVDKKEEEKHANTTTDEVSEENVESSHVSLQKTTSSEVTCNELATQITEPVCDTQTVLAHEKEISEEDFATAVNIQADGPNMQINQDKQDEGAANETAMETEKLGESNFQEHQDIGTEQKSPKETDEGDQQLVAKKEILTQELDVPETAESPQQAVESPQQTVSIKSNEDQELFDSKVQERDLNVLSPTETAESEENFVDVTKPEFSTDEEQSPKADSEEKIYDEMIKDIEGTKNFTDEAATKTEAPGVAQKARKKQSLLSGVGSKVKQQLAKVKKAIVGKPGRTKSESPKA